VSVFLSVDLLVGFPITLCVSVHFRFGFQIPGFLYWGMFQSSFLFLMAGSVLLFNSQEDSQRILDTLWTISGCSLMLKRWWISFDPASNYFRLRHLWVLLPGLPLQYWTDKALAAIGNELGRFICLDDSLLKGSDRKMARILVELDVQRGYQRLWISFGEAAQ
jgi:hypothetical protein